MNNQLSMIEVAEQLMLQKKKPQNINSLIKEVLEIKGYDDDPIKKAQLYIDITTSAKFVYCGENESWDLKERQSLELWDKDGSYFNGDDAAEEDATENELTIKDYNLEDEDEGEDEDEDEDEDEISLDAPEEEEDESSWDDDDEEKYNDMMDDYEDLYDDK